MCPCLVKSIRGLHRFRATLGSIVAVTLACASLSATQLHNHMTVFSGGSGCHYYRVPSIVATSNGTLVAVAEDRVSSASDWGNINLVCKRSTNDGASWSAEDEIVGTGPGGWTNPTMVYDPPSSALATENARTNGRIWLFFNWNSGDETSMDTIVAGDRHTYVTYSDDHGANWAARVDMTDTLTDQTNHPMKWDAVGPGVGIRMTQDHVGRLVVPATNRNFYSDDHGATWQINWIPKGTGEGTIVECTDGILYRNDRPTQATWALSTAHHRRHVSYGTIEGGFSAFEPDNNLFDPKCEGSILRYNWASPDRIVFLNSASTLEDSQEGRSKMYMRLSYDDGASWTFSRFLYDWLTVSEAVAQGKGGYSSMAKTTNSDYPLGVAILVETNNGTRSIDFHKVNLEWIRGGDSDP